MKTYLSLLPVVLMVFCFSCTKTQVQNPAGNSSAFNKAISEKVNGHFIGEYYGGGIIFWTDATGQHGLVADTVDLGLTVWSNGTNVITGAIATAIGTGKANTRKIIEVQGMSGNYAALLCSKLRRNGYSDWFLPSRMELDALYEQKTVVGVFENYPYWSSSENNIGSAGAQDFFFGHQFRYHKKLMVYVRAIRSF